MGEKKKGKKQSVHLKGRLKMYMQWPVIMGALLVAVNVWILHMDYRAGLLMFVFVVIYGIMSILLYTYSKSRIVKDLVEFAAQYGIVQNKLLQELTLPYAIFLEDGKAVWMNKEFAAVLGPKAQGKVYINKYIPELNTTIFPKDEKDSLELDISYGGKEYKANLHKVSVEGFSETERLLQFPEKKEYFVAVYLEDVTELNAALRAVEEQRMIAGLVYIDNYDEVVDSVEEVRQSLLIALVDRKINQYIGKASGIVRKMENDKYFIALEKKYFKDLKEDKFSVLEDVKSINIGNSIAATLSIGLGLSAESYLQSYNYARAAMDLALARGGDQAVIKDSKGITYFGGKREQTAKNTRVKARVKAEALREYLNAKDRIFIMGHRLADADAFGAAIGVYRAAAALNKNAHIVINEVSASLRPLYSLYAGNPNYPEGMLLDSRQALEMADENALVIVVDTNRPQMTECAELLDICKTIVVLDHHRQSADHIGQAVLSYVEPYASSASEMISEVLQYIADDVKLPSMEASSLYAGIVIDTNNFMYRTGVRTFEAAAYLRRCGADIALVKKMLRDDIESYKVKAAIISSAEVYEERFAIAINMHPDVESPTIIGAQAANELLDINEIKASFVLTVYNGKTYISARSIDEVNVQVIMEKLGGGGHINAAGAQLAHTDIDAAADALKKVISTMTAKGDL